MTEAAEILQVFLNQVSSLDIEGIKSLFAENVVQKVPFAPEGTPEVISGREAVKTSRAFR